VKSSIGVKRLVNAAVALNEELGVVLRLHNLPVDA
jgi:hypothetical protein